MKLKIEYLPTYNKEWGELSKAHPSDAGFDLRTTEDFVLLSKSFVVVPLGIKTAFEEGYEAQLRARSGLAAKYGIGLVNGIGTIDANYRGEWKVVLYNIGDTNQVFNKGDRICQVVFNKLPQVDIEYGTVDTTDRGEGGLGSTGVK